MKRVAKLNIRDKIDSYNLSFTASEVKEALQKEPDPIVANQRKTWLSNYPDIAVQISQQLKKYFHIEEKRELVFSYYPPELSTGHKLELHKQKEFISDRIILSTMEDRIEFHLNGNTEEYDIKSMEAYRMPPMISQLIDIEFLNKGSYNPETKRGFRSVKKVRNINNRHLFVFEYKFTSEDLENLSKSFKNLTKDNISEDTIKSAFSSLMK